MTPSCLSSPCAMDTGGSMLIIRHDYALLTRLLKSLNELSSQQHTLLVCGLITVHSVCQFLRIHLISVGNINSQKIWLRFHNNCLLCIYCKTCMLYALRILSYMNVFLEIEPCYNSFHLEIWKDLIENVAS